MFSPDNCIYNTHVYTHPPQLISGHILYMWSFILNPSLRGMNKCQPWVVMQYQKISILYIALHVLPIVKKRWLEASTTKIIDSCRELVSTKVHRIVAVLEVIRKTLQFDNQEAFDVYIPNAVRLFFCLLSLDL